MSAEQNTSGVFTLLLSLDVKVMNTLKRIMLSILRHCRITLYLSNRFTIDHQDSWAGRYSQCLLQFSTAHLQLICLTLISCQFQFIPHRELSSYKNQSCWKNMNVHRYYRKASVFLSDCNQNLSVLTNINRSPKWEISWISVQWESLCSLHTDGITKLDTLHSCLCESTEVGHYYQTHMIHLIYQHFIY